MVITIKFDQRLVVTSAIYLCLAIGVVAITFPYFGRYLPSDSSELASWVQALGSISAIIATAVIARSDGEHRKKQQENLENIERKSARYHLEKSEVLANLENYISRWRNFEGVINAKNVPSHLLEFKGLYLLKDTADSYTALRNSIEKLDDFKREKIRTGIASEVFSRIEVWVDFLDSQYEFFAAFAKNTKFYESKIIWQALSDRDRETLKVLHGRIGENSEVVAICKNNLSSCLTELNELLKLQQ